MMDDLVNINASEGEEYNSLKEGVERLKDNSGWELGGDGSNIRKKFYFNTWTDVKDFTNAVGVMCKSKNHHPEAFLEATMKFFSITLTWHTHDPPGLSRKDIEMAGYCEEVAGVVKPVLPGNAGNALSCSESRAEAYSSRTYSGLSEGEEYDSLNEDVKRLVDNSGWKLLNGGAKIQKQFHFTTWTKVLDFTFTMALMCGAKKHYPEALLKYSSVTVAWYTGICGLSLKDIEMADYCEEVAGKVVKSVPPEKAPSCLGPRPKV